MDAVTLTAPGRHSNTPCRCSETLIFFNQHGLPHSFESRDFFGDGYGNKNKKPQNA